MGVDMSGQYVGGLKLELTHGPSGTVVRTAAPKDNNGDGSSFSPTDMAAAALGACMVTIIAIHAQRDGIDTSRLAFRCEKNMVTAPQRRIGSIPLTLEMPGGLSDEQKARLEHAALTCPVALSLHPDIEKAVTFVYP